MPPPQRKATIFGICSNYTPNRCDQVFGNFLPAAKGSKVDLFLPGIIIPKMTPRQMAAARQLTCEWKPNAAK
jgi:hypothetical protein